MQYLLIFLFFSFISSGLAYAQPSSGNIVRGLLECSVFYETYGALNARSNKPSQELWDKSDAFKRLSYERASAAGTPSSDMIKRRQSFFAKKWNKRLLSAARPTHEVHTEIREWSNNCDTLGYNMEILPLPRG